mmetsp:Transcript_36409/g.71510  ORF Transcript_36409/g.71510 Transcript_36409/m.71510 type:complete len:303 (+) Transcript_36409:12-920(+)
MRGAFFALFLSVWVGGQDSSDATPPPTAGLMPRELDFKLYKKSDKWVHLVWLPPPMTAEPNSCLEELSYRVKFQAFENGGGATQKWLFPKFSNNKAVGTEEYIIIGGLKPQTQYRFVLTAKHGAHSTSTEFLETTLASPLQEPDTPKPTVRPFTPDPTLKPTEKPTTAGVSLAPTPSAGVGGGLKIISGANHIEYTGALYVVKKFKIDARGATEQLEPISSVAIAVKAEGLTSGNSVPAFQLLSMCSDAAGGTGLRVEWNGEEWPGSEYAAVTSKDSVTAYLNEKDPRLSAEGTLTLSCFSK